jgi:hypothetical protein
MPSALGRSVAKQELHVRMASPYALDVFSSSPGSGGGGVGRSSSQAGATAGTLARTHNEEHGEDDDENNNLRELRRQREDDLMTQRIFAGEQARRAAADEELRAERLGADQKVAAMQHEILTAMHGGVPPRHQHSGDERVPSSARVPREHQRFVATTPVSRSTLEVLPSASPLPPPPASPSSSRRPPSQSQQNRPIDSSLKHHGRRAPVAPFLATPKPTSSGGALRPLPASPASESLAQWLPHIQSPQSSSVLPGGHRGGGVSSMGFGSSSPRGASRAAGRQTATSAASRGKASSSSRAAAHTSENVSDDHTADSVAERRWLPQSFLSSNFQSIVKWAEMSFGEALIAQAAVDAAHHHREAGVDSSIPLDASTRCDIDDRIGGRGVDSPDGDASWRRTYRMKDDAQPSPLLTTAYCAIIDELLWNLPGFQHIWEQMRGEIFSSIFRLKKKDLVGVVAPQVVDSCGKGETSSCGGPTSVNLSLDVATSEQSRLKWFSRVCGRRETWFDTASAHVIKSHELQETLDNIHVSIEKYDLIFDIYDRTADRQITERAFRAWKTTTFRTREHNLSLQQVFARLHKRSPVLVAFHGWRRLIYQRKLRSSKDKDATVSAVYDARMKAKADELDRLQRQLEQETLRLRNNAEREARKHAALATNHAVELRELQSCQDEKDSVIISLEKIAKRWERLAKTCRPLMYRAPLPQSIMHIARGLHDAETEIAVKGPNPARLVKCRESLEKVLCTWVNHVLDTIESKAPRIKNTTTDIRDGEALMALCKHIISRSQNGSGGGVSGDVGVDSTTRSASANWSKVYKLQAEGDPPSSQPFLSTARGGAAAEDIVLQPTRTTSPQPARMITPQPADRKITLPPTRGRASMTSIALQLQQESKVNALHQVQSLHSVVIKALYLGTAEGLSPLLISTCPFAAKIIGREEEFLQIPHPTVGAWILASLFVCEMMQTFSQIGDPADVRFGCPAEAHVAAQVAEFSLMLSCDRTGNISTATSVAAAQAAAAVVAYVPQKKEDARESLRVAPLYQDGRAGKMARDRAAAAASKNKHKTSLRHSTGSLDVDMDVPPASTMDDTASDIEAFLGKDEETRRQSHFEFHVDRPSGSGGALMSLGQDDLPMLGEDDNNLTYVTSTAASSATDDDDVDDECTTAANVMSRSNPLSPPPQPLGDRKASKPFTSFRRGPLSAGAASATSPPLGAGAVLSPSSRRGTTVSINEATDPPTPPTVTSVSPTSALTSNASGHDFPRKRGDPGSGDSVTGLATVGGSGGGAVGRRAISPVRSDLQGLPMHALFRKIRRETRQKEEWLGLARLVTSVVLRYRVLDVDAPHKIRSSVVAPPPDVEPVPLPTPEIRRAASMVAKPVPPAPQAPKTAQPTAVPRSAPSSGTASPAGSAGLSRQSSNRQHSRGGSMFFNAADSSGGTNDSKPGSQPYSPVANHDGTAGQQRRSIVKFE